MKKTELLYVLEYYHPYIGGVETLFQSLAESFASEGHSVTVITSRYHGSLPEKENLNGVEIIRVPLPTRVLFPFTAIPYILKAGRHCDLIHTSSYNSAVPAFFAALLLRKKVIITFHEVWRGLWFKLPFLRLYQRIFYYVSEQLVLNMPFTRFVAVSDFTRERLLDYGIRPGRVERIYNGIMYGKLPTLQRIVNEEFTFTYFGRLGVSKGIGLLLNASKIFLKDNEAHCKIIISKHPRYLRKKVLHLAKQLNLGGRITILHDLPESQLLEELGSSHCVVIASHSEGFCFAALEACALNIPVISSDRGALKETVSNRHLKLKDLSVEELVAALEKAKRGEWDETPLRKFPISDTITGYAELYYRIAF